MTRPCDETIEHERHNEWVTDVQMFRRWGVPVDAGRRAVQELERDKRFPQRQPLFNDRRYFPAVQAYCMMRFGGLPIAADAPKWQEKLHAL